MPQGLPWNALVFLLEIWWSPTVRSVRNVGRGSSRLAVVDRHDRHQHTYGRTHPRRRVPTDGCGGARGAVHVEDGRWAGQDDAVAFPDSSPRS